jgi:hypothetical protein
MNENLSESAGWMSDSWRMKNELSVHTMICNRATDPVIANMAGFEWLDRGHVPSLRV